MWGALDIPTSGMVAQRIRLEAISSNVANKNALLDAQGNYNPYRKRSVEFAAGDPSAQTRSGQELGVHVATVSIHQDALRAQFDPSSPYADASGFVMVPDINPIKEQVDAMEAIRSYEANIMAAEAIKSTLERTLRLLA